ncbi:type II toxin-antitoxin system RelE/ParE family toxin [Limosilactobacillus mucosae]|uniref:type II toxin-antitoxin system RelE/ParE family toxin n=1 Tax=Limosilactobacillus mucosae TaxID=97478 RepID=UPI0022DF9E91|nr:type II toxin-antitoxin system RelE/ParE family toxin [Limosilactobacillus mucosae]
MLIELEYKTKQLKKICTDIKKARKKYGEDIADELHSLINFLISSSNLQEVNSFQVYHLHGLSGDRDGEYALDINGRSSGYRLIIVPLDSKLNKENITMFYESISIVRIEEVSKHYE